MSIEITNSNYSIMRFTFLALLVLFTAFSVNAQIKPNKKQQKNATTDSLYIQEFENWQEPDKVLHAEPLYIDLIRDLGARKGEKEWNVGFGVIDNNTYDKYEALVEYEWAPIDRLGLEVELPFSFYAPVAENGKTASNRLNSLKLAAQYTFLVSEKRKTSLAIGYIQEFELTTFDSYGKDDFVKGNIYNPFFIAAKRWGGNFHSLLYTGPAIEQHFADKSFHTSWQINSNLHYMISGTRNFVGLEFNKQFDGAGDFDMTIRPQLRVALAENLLVGIVTGIPISRENQRFSSFVRLIYEPKHKH